MDRMRWLRVVRIVAAFSIVIAIVYQIHSLRDLGVFRPSNFFSFFTIQSNIFAAVVLLISGLGVAHFDERRWDLLRGAAVLYMFTTGVVYGLLLTGYQEALQTHIPWVDTTLHRAIPLIMVADWLLDPPGRPIRFRTGLLWTLFPIAYLIYSLVRGSIVDWDPHPFLDPDLVGGYPGVLAFCVGIALGILGFVWLVTGVGGRWRVAPDTLQSLRT
ncbi:MAG: Pr6Pr family membrane protein [Chloroflexota bacterium]|nr:Pr6Pr family membrane protein [Chloroflexota bacterium]